MKTRYKTVLIHFTTALFLLTASGFVSASAAPIAAPASCGSGDPRVDAGTCEVTIDARDFPTESPLTNFNFIVSVDNTKLPGDPLALNTESNSPTVRTGNQSRKTFTLPDGRYLVSARSLDHKMWGAYFTLPRDADDNGNLTVRIDLTEQSESHPLPLGKIRVFVFEDNAWANGAPDTEEAGLGGFQVGLTEQTDSAVTVDYNNNPLCGGVCLTSADPSTLGFVEIPNLGPATYFINVHPPEGQCNSDPNSRWYQTTTIDGGFNLIAPTEEGANDTGLPGEQLWEPLNIRAAYWFGFVCAPQAFSNLGTGEITGTARNWVEWAPYTTGTFSDPVENPFVALSDSSTDRTVYVGRGDAAGNFDIQNVPPGSYNLAVWDEQLSYIMRFKSITVADGQIVDVNEAGDDGSIGLGVSRWFGWLDGYVYKDVNNNGQYDVGIDSPIPNTDMDQRWRDGSIKENTFTDPNGYYQYPTAEGGPLGRWFINEQGFTRFSAYPGPSVHDERTGTIIPSCSATPVSNPCIPVDQGGGLLTNQLLLEGHRATVDWGKRDYPPGTPGQIVGITYFATTRNEFDARLQVHENYEPAIPNVTVYLEGLGPDGLPNTADDIILNKYITDHWQQPSASQDPQPNGNTFAQNCNPILDFSGADITSQFNPDLGPNCLEVPLTGQHTRDGAFDGGYAFSTYCPESTGGFDERTGLCADGTSLVPLVAGTYITHVIMPKDPTDTRDCNGGLISNDLNVTTAKGAIPGGGQGCINRIVKEEDVNVDLGNQFTPAIPPPACAGDLHVIDQSTLTPRSTFYTGDQTTSPSQPLCDKRLVVLQNQQNANADFHLMDNFRTDPNGTDPNNKNTGDIAEPGRIVGQVFNDIYFERNQLSNWYGEPRPIGGIPIGIYARVDTVPNVNLPYDPNNWRLITTLTTGLDGTYEALLPSTETFNCPIPQGPCPGMYLVIVDDPGTKDHPNANYNPNLRFETTAAEVWPGLTDQLDTPIVPISGTACEDPSGELGPARPELLQVSRPYVNSTDGGANRQITIFGDFIGTQGSADATGGHIILTDVRTGTVTTLTRANGGIVSWTPGSDATPDTIVLQVPLLSNGFQPGPKQLTIITANENGSVSSVNGIMLHVLGGGSVSRVDNAMTNNGTFVLDSAVVAGDLGKRVTINSGGGGLAGGRTITSVTAGIGFTINNAATSSGTRTLTIAKVDTGIHITSGSNIVTDAAITAADNGRTVNFSGSGLPGTRTITNVIAGVSFRVSGAASTATGNRTATIIIRTDSGAIINNGRRVYDSSITANDNGSTVSGPGIQTGSTITSVNVANGFFVMNLPATSITIPPATVPLTITSAPSPTAYAPTIVNVPAPLTSAHALQNAIDNAAPGSLLVLSPGVYNENILLWKPLKIQGLGPGGIIGAHEFAERSPEDPRFNILGSIIDGRFFQQNLTAYDATVAAHAPYAVDPTLSTILHGADITVVAQSVTAYNIPARRTGIFSAARIDGLGLMTGHGNGAGGIQLQANINNMQITNDILENNSGTFAGGIGLGQPFAHESHNYNVRMANNRLIGNGGLNNSGGIGIFYGSNNYDVSSSIICSNFSVEYGAGVSHIGLSPNGSIHDNKIYYNEAVDSGGGIAIEGELVVGGGSLSTGSGAVNVDRNLIQSNISTLDDGGGIFVLDALNQPINIRNNMIVNNVAADLGGAIMLDDASRVSIINNTIANNATTATSETSLIGVPHGAGLTAEANDPLWQADSRYLAQYRNSRTRPDFSNPVALFNNIFWNNDAMTLSQFGPGATLLDNGFIDFEIHGTTNNNDTFTPRFSDLTNGLILGPNGVQHSVPGGRANLIGADPLFVTPFVNQLTVSGSRLDPQQAAVTITGQDPPVGLTGNYHIQITSPVIDRGVGYSNISMNPPLNQTPSENAILASCSGTLSQSYPADFDRQLRPQLIINAQVRTPWDLGADEVPGIFLAIPGAYTQGPAVRFNWNNEENPLCSASTVP